MNKVILQGRLTADPEVRYKEDLAIANFTLAVKRRGKKDEADFIRCIAFKQTAEIIEKYVSKGSLNTVCGRIQTGSYTNNEGQKVFTTDVIVEEIDFCESKKTEAKPKQMGFVDVAEDNSDGLPFN